MKAHTHARSHIHIRTHIHTHTLVHTRTDFCFIKQNQVHSDKHKNKHTCMHTHVRTHTYTHIHTHTHTNTHTYTAFCDFQQKQFHSKFTASSTESDTDTYTRAHYVWNSISSVSPYFPHSCRRPLQGAVGVRVCVCVRASTGHC